jgi:SAM-dependent methyltransferase
LIPVEDVARPSGAPCPLVGGDPTRWPRARSVLVRLPDRMRVCVAHGQDFSDAELGAVKDELGQIYADVSSKIAPDDFARDLKKLTPAAECRSCPRRAECPGCWVAEPGDPFGRDAARVAEILAGLAGAVLDVGCGEAPYAAALEPAVAAGRASYLGIDPDGARVALLSARHAWARYHVATAEELDPGLGAFEHALMLRSYNHLPDPARSVRAVARMLRPGGTLLVVDDVAFGLVRSREHARAAEAGPARFEHFRNDGAEQAQDVLSAAGLETIERCDVRPETSNQWLLWAKKPAGAPS